MNVVWFAVFELTVGTRQMDGQTDRPYRLSALLGKDCIKNMHKFEVTTRKLTHPALAEDCKAAEATTFLKYTIFA